MIDYIKCMTLTQNVSDDVYNRLSTENIRQINEYINAPMTATWFNERKMDHNVVSRLHRSLFIIG